jgi:hypothetical protein
VGIVGKLESAAAVQSLLSSRLSSSQEVVGATLKKRAESERTIPARGEIAARVTASLPRILIFLLDLAFF